MGGVGGSLRRACMSLYFSSGPSTDLGVMRIVGRRLQQAHHPTQMWSTLHACVCACVCPSVRACVQAKAEALCRGDGAEAALAELHAVADAAQHAKSAVQVRRCTCACTRPAKVFAPHPRSAPPCTPKLIPARVRARAPPRSLLRPSAPSCTPTLVAAAQCAWLRALDFTQFSFPSTARQQTIHSQLCSRPPIRGHAADRPFAAMQQTIHAQPCSRPRESLHGTEGA
mmetsp:Transcript_21263/g.63725  ORF Transcript_21263/g.63725 Transcript_21263/m.63725 type:complete len:227 (+) Transcript_21263:14-694(+)